MARTTKSLTRGPIVLRILNFLEIQGKHGKELTNYLGFQNNTIAKWKYDESQSYLKYIIPICNFLGAIPTYLFLGNANNDFVKSLTLVENEGIKFFRQLDYEKKKCIMEVLRFYLNESS